jgi:hypothetical protein
MDNKILLEDIKRMHELIGINPTILMESIITEGVVSKEAAQLLAKFFTNLEKSIVAGGKSYTKTQVKQILRKVGSMELSKEEKTVVQALSREAISLDKSLMKKLSNEIFGEMQKLTSRRQQAAYYSEVKKGLREILPKEELGNIISGVDAKISVKPKPAPNPKPEPTPPAEVEVPFVDIPDEEFMRILRQEFDDLGVPLNISAKQEAFFIRQIKPEINKLYTAIESTLPTKYKEIHLRYQQLDPKVLKQVVANAQKAIKDEGIGLNLPEKYVYRIGKYLEESLKENATNGYKKLKINLGLTLYSLFIDSVAGYVKTGDITTNQLFGMSLGQNAIFKSVLAFVGIFTKGIPSLLVAAGSALVSTAKDFPVIFDV